MYEISARDLIDSRDCPQNPNEKKKGKAEHIFFHYGIKQSLYFSAWCKTENIFLSKETQSNGVIQQYYSF